MYQHTARHADGAAIVVDPTLNSGREVHVDTKMCCHCGNHFPYKKGSGRIRGFCMRCMKMTCGSPRCDECFPIEERMDYYEAGLLPDLTSPRSEIKMKQTGRSKGGVILP